MKPSNFILDVDLGSKYLQTAPDKKKSFGLYLIGDQNLELIYRNYQRVHPGISRGMLQWDQN